MSLLEKILKTEEEALLLIENANKKREEELINAKKTIEKFQEKSLEETKIEIEKLRETSLKKLSSLTSEFEKEIKQEQEKIENSEKTFRKHSLFNEGA